MFRGWVIFVVIYVYVINMLVINIGRMGIRFPQYIRVDDIHISYMYITNKYIEHVEYIYGYIYPE